MPRKRTTRNSRRGKARAGRSARRDAVLYARVSTKDQEKEGFSIPAQERLLRSYADEHGFRVVEEFVDVETAKRAGRTNFAKMLTYLRRSKGCRVVLVEKTDRLYRNLKDWVTLDELDLEIHLVKEGVVLSDDSRSTEKFMHGIRVLMAKNYIDNLSEEATKGMREKARQGIWPSKAPLGYRNAKRADGKKVIEVDEEVAPLVVRVFEWAATGNHPLTKLTKMANDAGLRMRGTGKPVQRSTLHRFLHNPLYMGQVVWDGETFDGIHQPLISPGLWEQVQEALDGRYRQQRDKSRKEEFAFAGLLSCGHCGCALSGQIQKERYIYYHCTGYRGNCGEPYIREEVIAEKLAAALDRLTFDELSLDWVKTSLRASHEDQVRFHQEAIAKLEAECAKLQRRIDQIYIDKLDGIVDVEFFQRTSAEWREQQRRLRRTIARH